MVQKKKKVMKKSKTSNVYLDGLSTEKIREENLVQQCVVDRNAAGAAMLVIGHGEKADVFSSALAEE